jgi:hypothetical protein
LLAESLTVTQQAPATILDALFAEEQEAELEKACQPRRDRVRLFAPGRIVELTGAQALETSIVENLQRRDVHPRDGAQGFVAWMRLEEPKHSIEQTGAKVGINPVLGSDFSLGPGRWRTTGGYL